MTTSAASISVKSAFKEGSDKDVEDFLKYGRAEIKLKYDRHLAVIKLMTN